MNIFLMSYGKNQNSTFRMNADDGFDIFLLSFYASMKSQNVKILPGAFLMGLVPAFRSRL